MTCEIDVTAALGAAATLIYPEPDVYEVWDLGSDEFAVVFMDTDRVVRIEPLTIVPDDEWPFDESGVVGIERQTPPPPLPDLADDPFSDLPADASDEEALLFAKRECQKLLDNPDPRVAKLKAEFIGHLDAAADALARRLALAEQRLARFIDAEARRSRKTFHVVRGDKQGA